MFLVNFTLLKYVKSQRNYGFLITKELIFGFQILDSKDHFSASLTKIHPVPSTAVVAEWVRRWTTDHGVVGSNPTGDVSRIRSSNSFYLSFIPGFYARPSELQ